MACGSGLVPGKSRRNEEDREGILIFNIFDCFQNRRAKWRKSERLKEDQRKRDGSDHIGDDDKVNDLTNKFE